jgi:hypothetical protein
MGRRLVEGGLRVRVGVGVGVGVGIGYGYVDGMWVWIGMGLGAVGLHWGCPGLLGMRKRDGGRVA